MKYFRLSLTLAEVEPQHGGWVPPVTLPSYLHRHSSAMRQLLASMMTVDPQQRPHIPLILSQLEALQPPAPGQHTTQI